MPLDREHPPVIVFALDSFDYSVGRARRDSKSRCEIENALMVERVDRDVGVADSGGGSRARLDVHLMGPNVAHIVPAFGLVRQRAGNFRSDILNECSTEGDVEKLRPTADCENRFPGLARSEYKRYFSLIPPAVHRTETLVTSMTVECRIDVLSTGEHETVRGRNYVACSRRVG